LAEAARADIFRVFALQPQLRPMPYSAEISRTTPSSFVFIIDQSGSMAEKIPNSDPPKRKCDAVSDAINNLLRNLSLKCARPDGVRDYYYVGVIGYGVNVGPAWSGALANRELMPLSELAAAPAKVEERTKKVDDGAGGLVEQKVKFPVWFEPVANGGTPMCRGLEIANQWVDAWLKTHPGCFPPIVIHITDGESTDSSDPTEANRMVGEAMAKLKSLCSTDGNTLLFNVHLSSNPTASPISFPSTSSTLPDDYSRMLFDGASALTPYMQAVAQEHGISVSEGAKSFVLNAELALLIQALDIGTRASNLR
jgi:hypothetical protein